MIRAAVALSTHPDTARAALEAGGRVAEQLDGQTPDWAVAFATPEHAAHLPALQETLAGATGTPYVVGCSAAGVLAGGVEVEQGPALGVLAVVSDQVRGTPFLFRDEGDQGLSAGLRLGQRMQSSRGSEDILLVWADPFHVRPDRLIKSVDAVLGNVPMVGGASSARSADGSTFQFCRGEAWPDALAGLRLQGRFSHRIGITQGCRPLGGPLKVSRAHENLILELDGRPPLAVLREQAPEGVLDAADSAFHYLFVGLLPGGDPADPASGEYLVRNIVAVDPDSGVLGISDSVEEGQEILFVHREPRAARADLARVLDDLRPERNGADYRFGLYFNCLARGRSLYGEAGVDAAMIGRALPGVPVLGFFCNAEIGPLRGMNHLFTYTGVMALFGE